MMKQEFEQLIGKTVEWDVFKMYEAMYMATELSKQEFVNLLNIRAIPEDPAAIAAREAAERRRAEYRAQLRALTTIRDGHLENYRMNRKAGLTIIAASDRYQAQECDRAIRELRWFIKTCTT
jgi:hypothetical protein